MTTAGVRKKRVHYNSAMEDRFGSFRSATAAALLQGEGATPADLRQAIARGSAPPELMPLVEKIQSRPYAVTDADLDALRTRYSEDQLYEIVVAAALGAARARLDAAHRALRDA
jgi:alkylhydroperoxidase family enzyme